MKYIRYRMATPMKSVALSLVKTLSPRTPKLLVKSPTPKYISQGSPEQSLSCTDAPWRSKSQKRLDFSHSSQKYQTRVHLGIENYLNVSTASNQEKSEENIENLFITTPVKKDLIKNGLSENRKKVDVLGRGSFGTVVKGLYKDTLVAVKVIQSKNYAASFSDLNARKLSHQNIVKILEINMKPEENFAVIIMEYMEGARELQTLLESNFEIERKTKKKIIEDICSGLQCCHVNGILHLDIKPKNILVFGDNQCKICDFGNSCATENTGNYEFQGTVAYAAPELLKGSMPTTKCDIYSLGITIWQIEYRKNPYDEWCTNEALLYNVVKHHARPKYKQKKDLLTQVFERCWNQDSICRPEISEILRMLENVI